MAQKPLNHLKMSQKTGWPMGLLKKKFAIDPGSITGYEVLEYGTRVLIYTHYFDMFKVTVTHEFRFNILTKFSDQYDKA